MKQNSRRKKTITIFTCIAVLASSIFGYVFFDFDKQMHDPKTWHAYTSSDDRFNIQFPKDPVMDSKEMDIANTKIEYNELKTEVDNADYAVSYMDFPGKWKFFGVNKLLGKTFDMLMEQEPGSKEILEKQLASHNGDSALNYSYTVDGNEVKGKLVVVGNTLYRLSVKYPKALAEKIQPQAFLDSFEAKA